jgi:hypothetical protein
MTLSVVAALETRAGSTTEPASPPAAVLIAALR